METTTYAKDKVYRLVPCVLFSILFAASIATARAVTPGSFSENPTPVVATTPESEGNEKGIKWVFLMPDLKEIPAGNDRHAGADFPGRENSLLKNYLTELYTQAEPITPGSPMTRITIRKPAIFNAVKTIEKYYSSEVKKHKLTSAEAVPRFKKILEVAVAAASEDSEDFEDTLQQQRKDALSLIGIFNQVQLKEM